MAYNFNSQFTQNFIKELLARIDALEATITTLIEENARLREQLNKNSKNSSKPPSSYVFDKPTPKNLRKKSSKKQGVQKGHKGSSFSINREAYDFVNHVPKNCNA